MKTEEEIREAIKAAQRRERGIDVPQKGNPDGMGILAAECRGNYEALLWVLGDSNGHINGLAKYQQEKQ